MRLRFVSGLRQVLKKVRTGRVKGVIIAPNIEKIAAPGGLDDLVRNIVHECCASEVPVIYSLRKRKLGRTLQLHTASAPWPC